MKRILLLIAGCIAAAPLTSIGGEPGKIPAKAVEAMSFFVGHWEANAFENGEKIGTSVDRRTWALGEHCLAIAWSGTQRGIPVLAAGVAGWDAKANAIIEYWYSSQGDSLVVCYPLDEMKEQVWDGTSCFTTADGKTREGGCQLRKTADGFEYVAHSKQDGKEIAFKSVACRMSEGKSDNPAGPIATGGQPASIPAKAIEAMEFFNAKWESDNTVDGTNAQMDRDERRWVPGKYCLTTEWAGEVDGAAIRFYGICGWDPKTNALVDHWYGSQGQYLWHSYLLDNIKEQVWEGESRFTTGDGEIQVVKCQLTKTPDGFEYVMYEKRDGKDFVSKSVSRRVGPEKRAKPAPK